MGKAVFLFPGQGAQFPGMALDFLEAGEDLKQLFLLASKVVGRDMIDLLRNSSADELKRTDLSQPAITLANLAGAKYLELMGIKPGACAGFSLGEYAALATAGVISEEDCLLLVTQRGKAMQEVIDNIQASGKDPPSIAAVMGLSPSQVEALIAEWEKDGLKDLYAANYNSPKQVAISGSALALDEAEKRFKDAGARRVVRLQVGAPFHSPLLKEAADIFTKALEKVTFKDPLIPLFSNVTGKKIQSGVEAKALALRQIVESVRWTDVEASLDACIHTSKAELQPKALLEVGPGKVLQGLWKDSGSEIHCYGAGTKEEIDKFMEEL